MNTKAVITGDVVESSKDLPLRDTFIVTFRETCVQLKELVELEFEIFRGDSFQILLDDPMMAVTVAIVVRASLKAATPKGAKTIWDVRESIGIGKVEYQNESIGLSDGEAFQLSGRELEQIKKSRLTVKTPWEEVNTELLVSTAFLDNLITQWTKPQAKLIKAALLYDCKQEKLKAVVGTSQQNISKRLITARLYLVELYLSRYRELIKKYIVK